MASIDIEQLAELLAKAQTEITSRANQGRRDLRAELERRVASDGYKMADIFPELGAASHGPYNSVIASLLASDVILYLTGTSQPHALGRHVYFDFTTLTLSEIVGDPKLVPSNSH